MPQHVHLFVLQRSGGRLHLADLLVVRQGTHLAYSDELLTQQFVGLLKVDTWQFRHDDACTADQGKT